MLNRYMFSVSHQQMTMKYVTITRLQRVKFSLFITTSEETFLQHFLKAVKQMFQNFLKILWKCFLYIQLHYRKG